MLRRQLVLVVLALFIAACNPFAAQPTTVPQSVVVTATPRSVATPLPAATRAPVSATATPGNVDSRSTDVESINIKTAVNVRKSPSLDGEVLGQLFPGETAQVTGMSADNNWWRIRCPNDAAADCWVSADPSLTEAVRP